MNAAVLLLSFWARRWGPPLPGHARRRRRLGLEEIGQTEGTSGYRVGQAATIQLKLLKIGAVVLRNTSRIRFQLSSSYPYRDVFRHAVLHLEPG